MLTLLREASSMTILGKRGAEWEVVIIEEGWSLNGRFYPGECLRKAAPLFEGTPACAYIFGERQGDQFNHLPKAPNARPGGEAGNVVGYFSSPRFTEFHRPDGTKGMGIVARLKILEGAAWLRKNLLDAWGDGKFDLLGLSIDAEGQQSAAVIEGRKGMRVDVIEKVNTTDFVTRPAAGGGLVRLVASVEELRMRENFGAAIGGLAQKKGMGAEQLAQAAGMTLEDLQKLLAGERPTDPQLAGLAKALDVSMDDLKALLARQDSEQEKPPAATSGNPGDADPAEGVQEATALGDFLRSQMEQRDISAEQLGSAAGISPSTVSQIVRGEILRPPDARLRGFARVLGVSMERLLNLIPADIREEHNMEELLARLQESRPLWFGSSMREQNETAEAFLGRVLEAARSRASHAIEEGSDNDQVLVEHARTARTISKLLRHVNAGAIEEATRVAEQIGTPNGAVPATTQNAPPTGGAQETEPTMDKNELEELKKLRASLQKRETALQIREQVEASSLPPQARALVIDFFAGQETVEDSAIQEQITKYSAAFANVSDTGAPTGLGEAHGDNLRGPNVTMVSIDEKKALAMEGMLAGHAIEDSHGNKVSPYAGLMEAWGDIEGKWAAPEDVASWIFESIAISLPTNMRAWNRTAKDPMTAHRKKLTESFNSVSSSDLREAVSTGTFAVAFGDAMFKRLQKEYLDDPLNDWKDLISGTESFKDLTNPIRILRHDAYDVLPTVNEGAPYQEIAPVTPNEEEEQLAPLKKGGLVKLTWEAVLADDIGALRRIPRLLGRSSNRTIHELVWDTIENNAVAGGNALISAANGTLVTGSPALSYADAYTAITQLEEQTEPGSGKKLGFTPWAVLGGPKLRRLATEIFKSDVKINAGEDATVVNAVRDAFANSNRKDKEGRPAPFISIGLGRTVGTENHWYIMADPKVCEGAVVGFLGGRERPDIFIQGVQTPTQGAQFDADEITFKARMGVNAKWVDPRCIQGSLQ